MTTLYGNPVPPDFNDGEELSADDFNAVKNYWVTDELPDTAEDGDVVFVVESDPFDPNATPGLPGLGGWATITAVSGTYDKHTYNDADGDWVAYEWTGDGSYTVNTDGGLVDVLAVGSGQQGYNDGANTYPGEGGVVLPLLVKDEAGVIDVTVGMKDTSAHGAKGGSSSTTSMPIKALGGKGTTPSGYTSNITGNPVVYGKKGSSAPTDQNGFGYGGKSGGTIGAASGATSGVVIIRVPAANTTVTRENPHGWLNFATVENGVVTSVNKTPDNIPYTTAVDEVPCGPEVAEGWNYDGSEFVAPKPDYSEQIKELEETLKNLRSAK